MTIDQDEENMYVFCGSLKKTSTGLNRFLLVTQIWNKAHKIIDYTRTGLEKIFSVNINQKLREIYNQTLIRELPTCWFDAS